MIVVLTGAAGFLGDALKRELLAAGHRVRALVRDPSRLGGRGNTRLEPYRGDLNDPAGLSKALPGAEILVHAAGRSGPTEDVAGAARLDVDVLGTTLAAARAAGLRRAIVFNSALVLGPTDGYGFANERTRPSRSDFVCEEQRRKLAARDVARAARSDAFSVEIFYPAPLVGPLGPAPHGWLRALLDAATRRRLPIWPKNLGRSFSIVRVEDVAAACVALVGRGPSNEEFVLASEAASFETLLLGAEGGTLLRPRGSDAVVRGALAIDGWRRALGGGSRGAAKETAELLMHDWIFSAEKAESQLGVRFRPFVDAFVTAPATAL